MSTRTLRCLVEGRGTDWEAICLDFDITAQGSSYDEVVSTLNGLVSLYLEVISEMPEAERAGLVTRRAPVSVRLKFAWALLRSIFSDRPDGRRFYAMPLAADIA